MELETFVKKALLDLHDMGVVGEVSFDLGLDPRTHVNEASSNRIRFDVYLSKRSKRAEGK